MPSSPRFRFASALSTQPDLGQAVEQVCESALGQLQATPDLAVLFISAEYPAIDDGLAADVRARLKAGVLLGGTGESIVGTSREIEGQPAVSLWLASLEDVRVVPMHLQLERTPEGASIVGWPDRVVGALADRCHDAGGRRPLHVSSRSDGGAIE